MTADQDETLDIAERDRLIVQRVLDGDSNAFGELVALYQKPIYNLAYRMLGERTRAEDAAQEAFLRAYRHLHRYDPSRPFKTWLFSIASNYCIDRLRRRRLTWLSIDAPLPHHPALTSSAPDPEQAAIYGEHAESIQEMLDQIPPDYRLAVILRYWYDYSYAEIAEVTESTVSAVKSRLFRARRALAELIQEKQPTGSLAPVAAEG